jgi:hypothetical protein
MNFSFFFNAMHFYCAYRAQPLYLLGCYTVGL